VPIPRSISKLPFVHPAVVELKPSFTAVAPICEMAFVPANAFDYKDAVAMRQVSFILTFEDVTIGSSIKAFSVSLPVFKHASKFATVAG
jgi:hypothetical protein